MPASEIPELLALRVGFLFGAERDEGYIERWAAFWDGGAVAGAALKLASGDRIVRSGPLSAMTLVTLMSGRSRSACAAIAYGVRR